MLEGTLEPVAQGRSLRDLLDDYERGLILSALEKTGGNQRRAAAELGVLPTTLHEKLKRLGIHQPSQPRLLDEPQRGAA
jgi:DNA-binding NtrC family response regulator